MFEGAAQTQIAKTVQEKNSFKMIDTPVLGLAGFHGRKLKCRYADWRPNLYHQIKRVSSLVAVPSDLPLPPAEMWFKNSRNIHMKRFPSTNEVHKHS